MFLEGLLYFQDVVPTTLLAPFVPSLLICSLSLPAYEIFQAVGSGHSPGFKKVVRRKSLSRDFPDLPKLPNWDLRTSWFTVEMHNNTTMSWRIVQVLVCQNRLKKKMWNLQGNLLNIFCRTGMFIVIVYWTRMMMMMMILFWMTLNWGWFDVYRLSCLLLAEVWAIGCSYHVFWLTEAKWTGQWRHRLCKTQKRVTPNVGKLTISKSLCVCVEHVWWWRGNWNLIVRHEQMSSWW